MFDCPRRFSILSSPSFWRYSTALHAVVFPTDAYLQMFLIDGLQVGLSRLARIASTRPTARVPGEVLGASARVSSHCQFIRAPLGARAYLVPSWVYDEWAVRRPGGRAILARIRLWYDLSVAARDALRKSCNPPFAPAGYFVLGVSCGSPFGNRTLLGLGNPLFERITPVSNVPTQLAPWRPDALIAPSDYGLLGDVEQPRNLVGRE